jgi:hypothetical protein
VNAVPQGKRSIRPRRGDRPPARRRLFGADGLGLRGRYVRSNHPVETRPWGELFDGM